MDGFLLIDKPKGMTSMTCCNIIKKKFSLNKCGHNGTLDPNTTGVLVMGVNKGTKLMKLINEHDKTYVATILFGYDSDTLDIDGNLTNDISMSFTQEDLSLALIKMQEMDKQIPPMTSAIKINGKKLYEYQRKGIEIEVAARDIKIYDLKQLSEIRTVDNHLEVDIVLSVSKGFYVRSFARDLGKLLNGCAILKELRRTVAGNYNISDCVKLEDATINNIISLTDFFSFPKVEVNDYIAKLVKNGVMLDKRQTTLNEIFYVTNKCDIIAIYEPVGDGEFKPLLIF